MYAKVSTLSPSNSVKSLFRTSFHLRINLQSYRLQILQNNFSHRLSISAQFSTNFAFHFFKIPVHINFPSTLKSPILSPSYSAHQCSHHPSFYAQVYTSFAIKFRTTVFTSSFHLRRSFQIFRLQILYNIFTYSFQIRKSLHTFRNQIL